ncbi:MAG: Rieske (2Fe-2S) protein [Moraxellaceae bacterium]|nr:MAG: Rieske (2Fe-2S) protein [Moraxellaceae bacterium]
MAFVALEKLHQLYDGYRRVFRLDGSEWILLQEEGRAYCIANQCPHLQAPLAQASVANNVLRCPAHGIEFDLRSGQPINPRSCRHALAYLPLVYDGNQIGLDVN